MGVVSRIYLIAISSGTPGSALPATTYVRNIFKYYTAYKLMLEVEETQKKAREAVKRPG